MMVVGILFNQQLGGLAGAISSAIAIYDVLQS